MMAEPLGGTPTECTIVGYCRTFLFKFPGSYLVSEEPVDHHIVYSHDCSRAAIVSDLPAYFERDPADSFHYSIDVSLRVQVRSTYDSAIKETSRKDHPEVPLFIVIEEHVNISSTLLNRGECFAIDECRDGTPVVEGGREGERALLAIRTVNGVWPNFHADMARRNVVLAAVKAEQDITGHIDELYSCSCFVSNDGLSVYTLNPSTGRASVTTASRLELPNLKEKANRIRDMVQEMMVDPVQFAGELFDSILLDKTKDEKYFRLQYLRLWQALEDSSIKKHLTKLQIRNYDKIIAGKKTPKELYRHRNDIAHWYTGEIDYSALQDLEHTVTELLRRKYGTYPPGR